MKFPLRILFIAFLFLMGSSYAVSAYDHIVLISIDTLRPDYLSCYGSQKVKTPNIDSLAQRGILFKNTISSAPITLPSHISIFTGMFPPSHGVHDNSGFVLDPKVNTITKVLHENGFQSAAFLGGFPLDSRFGLNQGFDYYDDSYPPMISKATGLRMPERKGEEVVDSALNWLQKQTSNHWFIFVHLYDPHFPYAPPERFQKLYPQDLYAGEVAYADEQVGRILSYLKSKQLDQKTLIILTSDHGESLGEHGEDTHTIFAYESTLRVPLILSPLTNSPLGGRASVPAGKILEQRVRLIDVAPTILESVNLKFPQKIDGVSLLPLIQGKQIAASQSYFEALSMNLSMNWAPLRGFYSENFKFIKLPIPELYDLQRDPAEINNLCTNSDLCKRWNDQFVTYFSGFKKKTTEVKPVDSETEEKLRALGYVAATPEKREQQYSVDDDPKNLIPLQRRIEDAIGYYAEGYELKAIEVLEALMEEKPKFGSSYQYASFIWNRLGQPDKAVEVLRNAIHNGIDSAETHGQLGSSLIDSGKFQEGAAQLKVALNKDPGDFDRWIELGRAYKKNGDSAEAEKIFRQVLSKDASNTEALTNLGLLFYQQKNNEAAVEMLKKAVETNPHAANAYNALGGISSAMNKKDEAVQYWTRALEENPNLYEAMLNLGFMYAQTNQKDKAVSFLQRFEKNAPPRIYGQQLTRVRSMLQQLQAQN
jgi:arylsulfatase A-like enzyme/Tfp pilus assembly protein PilF